MDIRFDCDCGHSISTMTRGNGEVKMTYECEACGQTYAVTITPLN